MRTNSNVQNRNKVWSTLLPMLVMLCLLMSSPVQGQDLFKILGGQRVGTSAMAFLKIPVGARAEAMGGAYAAVANDAFAMYWNPAGIAQFGTRWQGKYVVDPGKAPEGVKAPPSGLQKLFTGNHAVGLVRNDWIADISYNALSYIQPLPVGTIGLTAASLTTADMEITTEYNPGGTGEYFSYSDMLIGLGYGLAMTDNFSFGVTAKYANEVLADTRMEIFMLDMGTYYWTGWRDLRIAVALMNFGPNTKPDGTYSTYDVHGNELDKSFKAYSPPIEFRLGAAFTPIAVGHHKLLISTQLNHPIDNSENMKLGAEYGFGGMLFLRGGYKINTDEDRYAFGAGVRVPVGNLALSADYSYTDFGILSQSQRFSLSLAF